MIISSNGYAQVNISGQPLNKIQNEVRVIKVQENPRTILKDKQSALVGNFPLLSNNFNSHILKF